jgi:hypothetical protein
MGALDAEGIYIYDDTEDVSPLNDYLNLGQNATSAAFAAVRGEIAAIDSLVDSDWTVIGSGAGTGSIGTGWVATVGHPPRLRKIGARVDIVGALTLDTVSGSYTNMLTIPVGFRLLGAYPDYFVGASVSSAGDLHQLFINGTTHQIQVPDGYRTSVVSVGDHIPLVGCWYVD